MAITNEQLAKISRYKCLDCSLIVLEKKVIILHARSTGHLWQPIPMGTIEEMERESEKTVTSPEKLAAEDRRRAERRARLLKPRAYVKS